MANEKAIEHRFLPRTCLQLQQRTAIWGYHFTTFFGLLPTLAASVFTYTIHLEIHIDTIKLSIEPLFHAELNINDVRTKSAL